MSGVDIYILSWHMTHSSAFYTVFQNSLRPFVDLHFHNISSLKNIITTTKAKIAMFLQVQPPEDITQFYERVIWVPMWDDLYSNVEDRLSHLPSSTYIIDFSGQLSQLAVYPSQLLLSVQFFFNPDDFPQSDSPSQTLFYWNRKSLLTKQQLKHLCQELFVDVLFWRNKPDYDLPPELIFTVNRILGKTKVIKIPENIERQEYLRYLSEVLLFIAPREREGIGLTFLEAMASGCVVIAPNLPTMNTYIEHGVTGFLLPVNKAVSKKWEHRLDHYRSALGTRKKMMKYQYERLFGEYRVYQSPLCLQMETLEEIRQSNLRQIGKQAREAHHEGFKHWQTDILKIANFISE